jgi:hypothetical protein
MWKSDKELYNECIKARALDYIANHEGKPVIEYLEFNAGPVLQTWMFKCGIPRVNDDLELKIIEEKS